MKKKLWLIPVAAIGLVLVLLIGTVAVIALKGWGISQGIYLEAKHGQAMFIRDNSPIEMSSRTERAVFDDLSTGDKILIIHDGIAESYPGKTGVYVIFKLRDGDASDIPHKVANQLVELGWLDSFGQFSGYDPLPDPVCTVSEGV